MLCSFKLLVRPFQALKPTDCWWVIIIALLTMFLTYPLSILVLLLAVAVVQVQWVWFIIDRHLPVSESKMMSLFP